MLARQSSFYKPASPSDEICVLRPKANLCFTNATAFSDELYAQAVTATKPPLALIIDGSSLVDMDLSAVLSLESTVAMIDKAGVSVSLLAGAGETAIPIIQRDGVVTIPVGVTATTDRSILLRYLTAFTIAWRWPGFLKR